MFGVADVLAIVERHGPSTLDELEAAAPPETGFFVVLDTCVDSGWLDACGREDESVTGSRYFLTELGQLILAVARRSAAAA